ncbi:MAG: DNA adenine methylase [Mycoplasmatales bacterium]|nr:DNA adenine methylase [Mycoplasmatales bacterium]
MKFKQSPVYYMGNKYKLLPQIWEMFPDKINTFHDLFGGSGTMSINFIGKAKKVHYNEFNEFVFKEFEYFNKYSPERINTEIQDLEDELEFTYDNFEIDKKKFMDCRNNWYEDGSRKNTMFHIFLKQFSFSNILSYDEDGFTKGGSTFGNRYYKSDLMIKKMRNVYNKDIELTNESWEYFINEINHSEDFVYVDPPYINTEANYNRDGEGWTMEMEEKLLNYLDYLQKMGIKWALSNVIKNKNIENTHLKEWAEKNNYQINYLDVNYTSMGEKPEDQVNETQEVLITNYDTKQFQKQLTLF